MDFLWNLQVLNEDEQKYIFLGRPEDSEEKGNFYSQKETRLMRKFVLSMERKG